MRITIEEDSGEEQTFEGQNCWLLIVNYAMVADNETGKTGTEARYHHYISGSIRELSKELTEKVRELRAN